jgi:nitrate reductase molybdenum cofactor assembly chaperone NarJ/NarW
MSQPMTKVPGHEVGTQLSALALLLEYPGADFEARLSGAALGRDAATTAWARFSAGMSALSADAREELYTATFDVTPACVAYVSIHLFGEENFKRGEFMAGLRARYQEASFDCQGELPDHLSVLLRFAGSTGEAERRELVEFCLLGPINKMIAALATENPYRALLEVVRAVLQGAYPEVQPAPSPLEQMQQHGSACTTITTGCNCGAITPGNAGASPAPVGARGGRAPQHTT